ncbi:MAG: gliding motility-associated C-terminal domain-containing protein [Bacteroidota bacterium]
MAFLLANCVKAGIGVVVPAEQDPEICVAEAGGDIDVCGEEVARLKAKPSVHPEVFGQWSQPLSQERQGISFDDPSDPFTMVRGLKPGQVYEFTWTLVSELCRMNAYDKMSVFTEDPPEVFAEAGADIFTCGVNSVMLEANAPSDGSGFWSTASGNAVIDFPDSESTPVYGLKQGAQVFYWSISKGACKDFVFDSVIVHFEKSPDLVDMTVDIPINSTQEFPVFSDPDDLPDEVNWSFGLVEEPAFGQVAYIGEGFLEYTPFDNFSGFDEIVYQWCSLNCPALCEEATIAIQIADGIACEPTNILTPNFDGANDYFKIPCLDDYPDAELAIFDNRGKPLYQQSAYKNDWAGRYQGEDLPGGTYFYLIRLNNTTNDVIQGFFMIHR